MNKETRQWIATSNAWIKQHQLSIDSCDMAIRHANEQITLLKKSIKAEQAERAFKVKQLKQVQQNIKNAK